MKISVVVTVLNEEASIRPLLDSLLSQTVHANEIVIVDGGSKDQTTAIIRSYQTQHPSIKLLTEPGSIARGRNVAVRAAQNEIIAQIDAGCIAAKNWLQKLTDPLNDQSIGIVAGFYEMVALTPFQEALAPFHGIPKQRFDPRTFLPSGRSMAFRKEVWEYVGGYSENLERAGEDTLFNYKVLKAGVRMKRVKDALVYWNVPDSFTDSLKKFFYYAKGDAQTSIWWNPAQGLATHNIKIMGIFARYLAGFTLLVFSIVFPPMFLLLVITFNFYVAWSIWKMRDVVLGFKSKLFLPIIQVSSDIAIMWGFLSGIVLSQNKNISFEPNPANTQ